ncbi:TasA family protein [Cytobacillus sp. FJAT-54145]|uniref:TasA family protein n=1 Tax=Cytobacillus spartinae TaxID=3299023 RepID=A0ABW6KCX8_9BACI
MSIKKKMGMGILAGALGVSLIGGGTWAAFNDVEEVSNSFEAGTLDLVTSPEEIFNLSNLKPGDYFEKELTLSNNGSLTIKDILVTTTVSDWDDVTHSHLPDNGVNDQTQFLNQFKITVKNGDNPVFDGYLGAIQSVSESDMFGNDVALEPEETVTYDIRIEFEEDDSKYSNSRLHEQNKYQGEGATFGIKFEATQMDGEERGND